MINRAQAIRAFSCLFLIGILVAAIAAQDTNRRRVVIVGGKKTTPTPTPTPLSTPKPTKLAGTEPSVLDKTPVDVKSYVTAKVSEILANPMLSRGRIGVRIDSLDSRINLYSRDADRYFMPASNMKGYTVGAALDELTPNFRFTTSVYSTVKPNSNGVLDGSLIVFGRGDPSFSATFYDGDKFKAIDKLVDKIAAAGIKRIEGSLIGDETYFNSKPIPNTWEWDDLQWYYGAEISSLTFNDNSVDLSVSPTTIGKGCVVVIDPSYALYQIVNRCTTTPAGSKRELRITKRLEENIVEIAGTIPEGTPKRDWQITVSRPARFFVEVLKQRLVKKGITIKGEIRVANRQERAGMPLQTQLLQEITEVKSPPLSEIAARTMKPSQNLYTELILRTLGEEKGDRSDPEKTSLQKGIERVSELLRRAGAPQSSIVQYDGSGLSRHNLITPTSGVLLYRYMDRSPGAKAWRDSLTIGGIDGTLKRRFIGTNAANNVRGKTGTIDQVSALTGYVTAVSGERFVFSIQTNNIPNSRLRGSTIDQIVNVLADYDKAKLGSPTVNSNQR